MENKPESRIYRELDRCLRDQEYEKALDLILKCKSGKGSIIILISDWNKSI